MRPRWFLLLFVTFAVLLVIGVNAWSRLETLVCDRDARRVRCVVTRDAWLTSGTTEYADVIDMRTLDLYRGQWAVTLVGRRGEVDDVAEEITEREAKDVISWFGAGRAHIEVARERYPWRMLVFSLTMLLCLAGVSWGWRFERRNRRAARVIESDGPTLNPP